jgi:hypothetical protein
MSETSLVAESKSPTHSRSRAGEHLALGLRKNGLGAKIRLTGVPSQCKDEVLEGVVAQLGERIHGMDEVRGSIPLNSTLLFWSSRRRA